MFMGLVIFSTLRLAQLQVYPLTRPGLGSCEEFLPLNEFGSFTQLSTAGLVVHAFYTQMTVFARIIDVNFVCQANGLRRGTSSSFSAIVQYECSGNICPGPTNIITEQYQLDCRINGGYHVLILNSGQVRSEVHKVTGTLNTQLDIHCGQCSHPYIVVPADPETHCVGKFWGRRGKKLASNSFERPVRCIDV